MASHILLKLFMMTARGNRNAHGETLQLKNGIRLQAFIFSVGIFLVQIKLENY